MKITFLILLNSILLQVSYSQSAESEIRGIMDQQVKSWNIGDLEGFMKGYWESDELVFIGSKGLTYGWKNTLENYQKSYPTHDKMGELSFEYKEFKRLGKQNMLVIGQWRIERPDGELLTGHFSLTWQLMESEWVIIADHSS